MDRRSAVVGLATLGPMLSARSSAQALRNARVAWVTFARTEPDSPFSCRAFAVDCANWAGSRDAT